MSSKAAAASSKNANAASDSTAIAATVAAAQPVVNGAVEKGFLKGKTFILEALFDEVHPEMREAHQIIKKMLESFGAKVNKRFSSNTSKYSLLSFGTRRRSLSCSALRLFTHSQRTYSLGEGYSSQR